MYLTALKYLAPVVLISGILWAAHDHGVKSERARWEAKAYQATITAHETASKFTSGVLSAHQETEQNAQTKIDSHNDSTVIAGNASDRLRDEIDTYIQRSADSSAAFAEYRKATEARLRVLAHMHDLSDRLAGIYAEQADKSRIAGDSCVAAYESLKIEIESIK
jgi:hypothetical protein